MNKEKLREELADSYQNQWACWNNFYYTNEANKYNKGLLCRPLAAAMREKRSAIDKTALFIALIEKHMEEEDEE